MFVPATSGNTDFRASFIAFVRAINQFFFGIWSKCSRNKTPNTFQAIILSKLSSEKLLDNYWLAFLPEVSNLRHIRIEANVCDVSVFIDIIVSIEAPCLQRQWRQDRFAHLSEFIFILFSFLRKIFFTRFLLIYILKLYLSGLFLLSIDRKESESHLQSETQWI